uniref:Uncharacterized protein n=1 Tax=viral metagenome TaxID=1070528 RepID=A0A6C0BNV0_9ZZZZ
MIIPEEIAFIISEYSQQCFPGLSCEYILREIQNLQIDYHSISLRASELGLEYLVRYIIRPVNLSIYVHMIQLLHNDWINVFIRGELHKISIEIVGDVTYLRLEPTTDDNLITLRSSLPGNIISHCIDGAVYVKMALPELTEFINAFQGYKHIINPLDGYPERFSFLRLVDYDIDSNPPTHTINNIQTQVYESVKNSNIQGTLRQDQLLSILNQQRLRYNIIQSILDGDLTKYGVNYNELKLIDYMIKEDIPMDVMAGSHKIVIRSNNDEVIIRLTQLLRRVYPQNEIRTLRNNDIISFKLPITVARLRDIRYNNVDGCVIMRPGLYRTIRMIQSLHCAVTTTKIHVSDVTF